MTDDTLVRAYINISQRDKDVLELVYGHGWSAKVRELIHAHVISIRTERKPNPHSPTYIGDFDE